MIDWNRRTIRGIGCGPGNCADAIERYRARWSPIAAARHSSRSLSAVPPQNVTGITSAPQQTHAGTRWGLNVQPSWRIFHINTRLQTELGADGPVRSHTVLAAHRFPPMNPIVLPVRRRARRWICPTQLLILVRSRCGSARPRFIIDFGTAQKNELCCRASTLWPE